MSRVFRYPLARWIVRGLVKTSITPDQVTLVQPLFFASAGLLWIAGVIALKGWFVRRTAREPLTTEVAG